MVVLWTIAKLVRQRKSLALSAAGNRRVIGRFVRWRFTSRSGRAPALTCAALLVYLIAATGLPVVIRLPVDESEPFPCQAHGCGCSSAFQCWTNCCCFTQAEKLAWAARQGVAVPEYVASRDQADRTSRADQTLAGASVQKVANGCAVDTSVPVRAVTRAVTRVANRLAACCASARTSRICAAKPAPARICCSSDSVAPGRSPAVETNVDGEAAARGAGCCVSTSSCSLASCSKGTTAKGNTATCEPIRGAMDQQRGVLIIKALACRGLQSDWIGGGLTILPPIVQSLDDCLTLDRLPRTISLVDEPSFRPPTPPPRAVCVA
jgi:hypothetical protein